MAVSGGTDLPCGGGNRPSDGPAFCEALELGQRLRWPQAKPLASPRSEARLSRTAEVEDSGLPPFQPLRTPVTALAATPHIGGCVHSPHGRRRCTPPVPARRWAAGPPQRLEGGKARILFLTALTEPSESARRGEGLGLRPQTALSDPSPFAEGGAVRRTAPAAALQVLDGSHSPPHQPPCSARHRGGQPAAPPRRPCLFRDAGRRFSGAAAYYQNASGKWATTPPRHVPVSQ